MNKQIFRIQMRNFSITDKTLLLALFIYLVMGFVLLGYYQYQINPDRVGYIQTALKYVDGDIYEAIDAYWGPLFSWLLVPFLYFNQAPAYSLYSSKILSLIIGFITLIGIRQLSNSFEMDKMVRATILFLMVPVLIYFSLSVITPDLLVVCLLVYYFSIIFNSKYPDRLLYGMLCGLLGAMAFFAKSFIFPFFIAQFLILNVLHYRYRNDYPRFKITRNMLVGLLVFLLLSGVWIGLISSKEGKLTFGTSGEYNHALVGPGSNGFPQFSQGLSAPGEINQEKALKNWSPFDSWSNFSYQMSLIWNNLIQTISIYQFFSCISLLIILSTLLIFIPPFKQYTSKSNRRIALFTLITVLIYSGGYFPVLVEERYLWPVYILLILLGGLLTTILFKNIPMGGRNKNVSKIFILTLFSISFILMPLNSLYMNMDTGKDIYLLSESLKNQYGVQGNIATNDQLIDTQYLSFYMNTTSFGQSRKDITDRELELQLLRYGIDYYLVWGDSNPTLAGYTEITQGRIKDLKIYKKK
jgi:hypothetical protein